MSEVLPSLLPGLIVLALGLLGAGLWALITRHDVGPTKPLQNPEDLDARLGHVLAHLKDLAAQQTRLSPESYAQERARLEAQAASLLRARDEKKEPTPTRSEEPTPVIGFFAKRPTLTGFLWGGGTMAVLALLWGLVNREQAPRTQGAGMTGGSAPMAEAAPASSPESQEIQSLLAQLQREPTNIDARSRLAHLLLRAQMLEEAKVVNDSVLQLDPNHEEARVHQAVLDSTTDPDGAVKKLTSLVDKNPKLSEAWLFRGMIGMRTGNQPLMQESFKQFVATAPDGPQKERIRAMLGSAQ